MNTGEFTPYTRLCARENKKKPVPPDADCCAIKNEPLYPPGLVERKIRRKPKEIL